MTPERGQLLRELLEEVMDEDELWVPQEAFWSFQRFARLPFNELIVPRRRGDDWTFFLARRDPGDPEWKHEEWHIPGTRWDPWRWSKKKSKLLPGEKRERIAISQAEACEIAGRKEFGVSVGFVQEIGTATWHFDYRYPISHLAVCFEQEGHPIRETERRRFFSLDELPEPMVPQHADFLRSAEHWLRSR